MLRTVICLAARLPLRALHGIGALLGWAVYWGSPTYSRRLRENLHQSGVCADGAVAPLQRQVIAETGKGVLELAALWFAPDTKIQQWAHCDTWPLVERARKPGQGIIFLTPHLGGFEICAQYISQRMPITVLYRPPKLAWLEPLMIEGRSRWQTQVAPANLRGVRLFIKALREGRAVGLLPDQTPGVGEGAWADFFGRPAFTMTLVGRLQRATNALLVMVHAQRLARGNGYQLHFEVLPAEHFDERALNRAVEAVVRRCPAQYLWGYNRYKVPAGAPPPPAAQRAHA
ncbi:MAG: lysophospholipid acyltransferase family protein [Betaproteobacteria bacterium]|nr:lysophospholipid acyltransferase family protein [Betaproteobacteria bacterium]